MHVRNINRLGGREYHGNSPSPYVQVLVWNCSSLGVNKIVTASRTERNFTVFLSFPPSSSPRYLYDFSPTNNSSFLINVRDSTLLFSKILHFANLFPSRSFSFLISKLIFSLLKKIQPPLGIEPRTLTPNMGIENAHNQWNKISQLFVKERFTEKFYQFLNFLIVSVNIRTLF